MPLVLVLVAWAGGWTDLTRSALTMLEQGKFTEAEHYARQAVKISANDHERGYSNMNLGRIYRDWVKCEPAVNALERGVQAFGKTGDRGLTMEAASQLISAFVECGAVDRALAVEKRFIDLAWARANLSTARFGQMLGNAGVMSLMRKKYRDAEAQLLEAAELARPIDQAIIHGTLALLYFETRRPAEGIPAAERAYQLTVQEMGETHPLAVRMLANLSALHNRFGNTAQGDAFHEQAMALLVKFYEADSPLMADVLENRALALKERRRKSEARVLETQAREIRSRLPSQGLRSGVSVLEFAR